MTVYRVIGHDIILEDAVFSDPVKYRDQSKDYERTVKANDAISFSAVGRGRPLTVDIRHVYTGRHPDRLFQWGKAADIAVVSGVKNFGTFEASARALNFIAKSADARTLLNGPSSLEDGTSIILYSPALLARSVTITLELSVAHFPAEVLEMLSKASSKLAGMPILLPYTGYLLAAGQVFSIGQNLGRALFDGPVFSITEELRFEVPGYSPQQADLRILTGPNFPAESYIFDTSRPDKGLIDSQGRTYNGDEPYIIISLDGREEPELKTFAPSVMSAALLTKFFNAQDNASIAVDTIIDGVRLVSDVKHRARVFELDNQIKKSTNEGSRKALEAEREAVNKNITTNELRL